MIEPVSSTQIGAFISLSHAAVRRGQSSGFSLPVRRLCDSTRASLHIIRCVTSLFDISSVKSATGTSWRTARFCAMQSASADFPIDGRAATMIRLPGLEARGELVELLEAGRDARHVGAGLVEVHDPLEALLQQPLDVAEVARDALLGELEDDLLGPVDEVGGLPRALLAEPGDLRAGADEAAQRRHLAHDPRVVGRVRGRGDEGRELVDPRPGRRPARARPAPRARRRA